MRSYTYKEWKTMPKINMEGWSWNREIYKRFINGEAWYSKWIELEIKSEVCWEDKQRKNEMKYYLFYKVINNQDRTKSDIGVLEEN